MEGIVRVLALSQKEVVVLTDDFRVVVVDRYTGEPLEELELVRPEHTYFQFLR